MSSKSLDIKPHSDKTCSCYMPESMTRCSYEPFPDGWDFTHDVGQGQVRGEVFTPLHLVENMIMKSGLLPAACFDGDYSTLTTDEMVSLIESKVFEPAVGTGNFITVILWHKLNYAVRLVEELEGRVVPGLLEKYFFVALASCCMNDIDTGNLETVKRRILSKTTDFGGAEDKAFWTTNISDALERQGKMTDKIVDAISDGAIEKQVNKSLSDAVKLWTPEVNSGGLVNKVYEDAVGTPLPDDVFTSMMEILDSNVRLFSSLSEFPSLQYGLVLPGWRGENFVTVESLGESFDDGFVVRHDLPAWKSHK